MHVDCSSVGDGRNLRDVLINIYHRCAFERGLSFWFAAKKKGIIRGNIISLALFARFNAVFQPRRVPTIGKKKKKKQKAESENERYEINEVRAECTVIKLSLRVGKKIRLIAMWVFIFFVRLD